MSGVSEFSTYSAVSLLPEWCQNRERDFYLYMGRNISSGRKYIDIPIERDADFAILTITATGPAGFYSGGAGDIPSQIPDGIIKISEVTTSREWSNIPIPLQSCMGFGGFISGVAGPPFAGIPNYQYVLPCPWIVPRRGVVRIEVVEAIRISGYYGLVEQVALGGIKLFGAESGEGFA